MTVAGPPPTSLRAILGETRPAFNGKITNPDAPATEKQIEYLRSLGRGRDIGMTVEDFDIMFAIWLDAGVATKGFVSDQIEEYKGKPKRSAAAAGASPMEAAPGYYSFEGKFYVVVQNKAKTHTYAKVLSNEGGKWSWEYAPGVGRKMAGFKPLDLTEAAKFGHMHGVCMICCRPLTDPKSVTDGIGPVCAKKVKR